MGVNRNTLPKWENIQFLPAQLHKKPLLDDEQVFTKVVIGKKAKKNIAQHDINVVMEALPHLLDFKN